VLVGHSFGGFNVRVYNHEYPNDVVGVVLVDGAHEDQVSRMSPALQAFTKKQAEALNKGRIAAPFLIRFGILRLISKLRPPTEPFGGTKELLAEILYLQLQPKFRGALASESEFAFSESADEVRAAGNLGDKPLIVLTAGKTVQPLFLPKGESQNDLDDFHTAWVADLQPREVHLSTRGKQIMVNDSDHMIPFERPDAIVNAVREVCAAVNLSTPTPP
jgi:pimeloyl-ACP methyl ester carboxylesterase